MKRTIATLAATLTLAIPTTAAASSTVAVSAYHGDHITVAAGQTFPAWFGFTADPFDWTGSAASGGIHTTGGIRLRDPYSIRRYSSARRQYITTWYFPVQFSEASNYAAAHMTCSWAMPAPYDVRLPVRDDDYAFCGGSLNPANASAVVTVWYVAPATPGEYTVTYTSSAMLGSGTTTINVTVTP